MEGLLFYRRKEKELAIQVRVAAEACNGLAKVSFVPFFRKERLPYFYSRATLPITRLIAKLVRIRATPGSRAS